MGMEPRFNAARAPDIRSRIDFPARRANRALLRSLMFPHTIDHELQTPAEHNPNPRHLLSDPSFVNLEKYGCPFPGIPWSKKLRPARKRYLLNRKFTRS